MGSDWLRGCFKPVLPASRSLCIHTREDLCVLRLFEKKTPNTHLFSLSGVHSTQKKQNPHELAQSKVVLLPIYIFLLCKCQLALPSNFTVLHSDPAVPQDHFGSDASFEKQRQLCNDCTCVIFICKHARCTTVLTVHSCNCTQHQRYILENILKFIYGCIFK